eukprot:7344986-Alexandrium_andersonii.AAC.1
MAPADSWALLAESGSGMQHWPRLRFDRLQWVRRQWRKRVFNAALASQHTTLDGRAIAIAIARIEGADLQRSCIRRNCLGCH